MVKNYKWTRVMKKSVVFAMALSICLGVGSAVSNKEAKAATTMELTCSATAYTAQAGSTTSSGRIVNRNPNGLSTVAVDPNVIPIGSALYIDGYGYAIAADTGSAIKGNVVDVFFDNSSDCYDWGKQTVKVIVIGDASNS